MPTTTLPADVQTAVDQLTHAARIGALPADEAADIRTLLAFVTGGAR